MGGGKHGSGASGTVQQGVGGTESIAQMRMDGILIEEIETKDIMTKSSLPVGGYSFNPYVGYIHACRYRYASLMERSTGHTEEWDSFLDVKHWPEIKNLKNTSGSAW